MLGVCVQFHTARVTVVDKIHYAGMRFSLFVCELVDLSGAA